MRRSKVLQSKTMRKISNIAVAILFIISVVLLFKYSSLPNVLHIAWLEKPKQESGICVSLATSFVIPAMFYFIMNYLPELIGNIEKEEKAIPRRKIVQCEVREYIN